MQAPILPVNEFERLAAVHSLGLLDSPPEERFDRLTRMACRLFDVPVSLITLVDGHRQWIKSRQGIEVCEISREVSFCGHTILNDAVMEIPDAATDERFADNILVTGATQFRFYAGVPLCSNGFRIGTLCLFDTRPRHLDENQRASLRDLGAIAEVELNLDQTRQEGTRQLQAFTVLNELASAPTLTIPEQTYRALKTGAKFLKMETAVLTRITGENVRIRAVIAPPDFGLGRNQILEMDQTLCREVIGLGDLLAVDDIKNSLYSDHSVHTSLGIGSYIGIPLFITDGVYGTLSFMSRHTRPVGFSEAEILFVRLLGRWASASIERNDSTRALRRSETRLRALFLFSPIGIALNDFETGAFIEVNPAIFNPTGYTEEEFLALSYWDLTPRRYEMQEQEQIRSMAQTGRYGPYEKEYLRKDGSTYPVCLNGVVVEDVNGKKLIWSMVEDLSEKKRLEQLKSQFVATVSHELRTPLTVISASLGLLAGGTTGDLPKAAADLISVADKNCKRLGFLINDLLDMEKLIAGKMPLDMQKQSLCQQLQQAVDNNQAYADQFNVRLVLNPCDQEIYVVVDAQRFQQVLANLLSNAAKFSPEGGTVNVSAGVQGSRVHISVSDQGSGIPEAFQAQIFQKFAQADASDSRQKGGTGLGLAITRELVEHMAGRISFKSRAGEGTTFFVEFGLA